MQHDQASKLRSLVSQSAPSGADGARHLVISGCKGGVGTTTLAINLSIALRQQASRVLLVDANPARGDIATMCRLRGDADIDDVLDGRESIEHAIVVGPADIQVLPRFGLRADTPSATCRRLIRHLTQVITAFDYVVIDAGSCPLAAEVLWPSGDAIVVTTTDFVAVTDAYALIKSMTQQRVPANVGLVVNMHGDKTLADDVAQRLAKSCSQFLQLEVKPLVHIPHDPDLLAAQSDSRAVRCAFPDSVAAVAVSALANRLTADDVVTNDLRSLAAS